MWWWLVTIGMTAFALLEWQRRRVVQKRLADSHFLTSRQVHQIKNDLTAVHVAIEGLALTTKDSLPVEQHNTITFAAEYSHRLKRSVCELLELEILEQHQQTNLRMTKVGMHELMKCREVEPFWDDIKNLVVSRYGMQAIFQVDKVKFLQLIDSFCNAVHELSTAELFSFELDEDDKGVSPKFVASFELKKDGIDLKRTLSYRYVEKLSPLLGLVSIVQVHPDQSKVRWEVRLPKLQWQKQTEKILFVGHGDETQAFDIANTLGSIVESVSSIEAALYAIQQDCFSTVVFDGSKELGQQLALAKILRHDLHVPARTVLVSPEKAVNAQLASEFGIDSVMDAGTLAGR